MEVPYDEDEAGCHGRERKLGARQVWRKYGVNGSANVETLSVVSCCEERTKGGRWLL